MKLCGVMVRCPACGGSNDVDLSGFPDDFAEFVTTCAVKLGGGPVTCGESISVRVRLTAVVDVAHIIYPQAAKSP